MISKKNMLIKELCLLRDMSLTLNYFDVQYILIWKIMCVLHNVFLFIYYTYSTDRAKVHTKYAKSKYTNLAYGANTRHQKTQRVL